MSFVDLTFSDDEDDKGNSKTAQPAPPVKKETRALVDKVAAIGRLNLLALADDLDGEGSVGLITELPNDCSNPSDQFITTRLQGDLPHRWSGGAAHTLQCSGSGLQPPCDRVPPARLSTGVRAENLNRQSQSASPQDHLAAERASGQAHWDVHPTGNLEEFGTSQAAQHGRADLQDQGSGDKVGRKRRTREEVEEEKEAKRMAREAAAQAKAEAKERAKAEKAAAKEEAKRAKEAQKALAQADKEAGKVAKEAEKAAKGKHKDKEITVQVDVGIARSSLWVVLMPQLHDMTYEYNLVTLPLAPLPAICWTRRPMMGALGEGSQPGPSQTDAAGQEVEVPYVMLAFHDPEQFLAEVLKDGLRSLVGRVAAMYPSCTLGLLVVGLERLMERREKQDFRQDFGRGGAAAAARMDSRPFVRSEVEQELVEMTLRWPAVRLRRVGDMAQAAEYIVAITRALAHQPYENQDAFLDSFGGLRDSAAARTLELELDAVKGCEATKGCVRALCTLHGVGPKQAFAVIKQYGSIGTLMQKYTQLGSHEAKKKLLADMMYDAPSGSRRVGPAISSKLLHFLTAEDPDAYLDE